MREDNLSDIIRESLTGIRSIAESETIVGAPLNIGGGMTVIPVSKVTLGIATGGIDTSKRVAGELPASRFGGAGGTGVNISPIAFLVVKPDGSTDIQPVMTAADISSVDKFISAVEKSPEIVKKIAEVLRPSEG